MELQSRELAILDELGIQYTLKNSRAFLKEWDSLSMELTGQYKGHWKRWSNGRFGASIDSLLLYFVEEGLVEKERIMSFLSQESLITQETNKQLTKAVTIKETKPYDFSKQVKNEDTALIKEYLVNYRMINESLLNSLIKKGLIIQDGRNNARFLWKNRDSITTGADVQGINQEKRFKLVLPGSKGLFNVPAKGFQNYEAVKTVYVFEAPIDLISYAELASYGFYELQKDALLVSLSGSDTKVLQAVNCLKNDYAIDTDSVEFVVCTDNDDAGNRVYSILQKEGYKTKRVKPYKGESIIIKGVEKTIKDWNEELQYRKTIKNNKRKLEKKKEGLENNEYNRT